jgi:hypothetical protein
MSAKQILLDWLAKNELKKVFQGFFFLAEKYKDGQLRSNTAFQSGRLKSLENQWLTGTISQEEEHLQSAKIREALLHIIQGLPDDWTLDGMENAPPSFAASSKSNWKKYAVSFAAVIAVMAGIAELSGYSISDIFHKKETTEIPAKIQPPAINLSTTGDNSPAIITNDGDVNINYGEPKPKADSTNNQ